MTIIGRYFVIINSTDINGYKSQVSISLNVDVEVAASLCQSANARLRLSNARISYQVLIAWDEFLEIFIVCFAEFLHRILLILFCYPCCSPLPAAMCSGQTAGQSN